MHHSAIQFFNCVHIYIQLYYTTCTGYIQGLSVPDEIVPTFQDLLQKTVVETSWNLPLPLCSWDNHDIREIVHQVSAYIQ